VLITARSGEELRNAEGSDREQVSQRPLALAEFPPPDARTPEGLQRLRSLTANNEAGTVLTAVDHEAPTVGGDVRLHAFVPEAPVRGVMLRIHGGGWAAGAPEDDDTLNDQVARGCGIAVVSPEYRLTPDATIADQIDECVAVAEWLGANELAEFGSETLLLGGISAGAHLAAAMLLRLRDARSETFGKFIAVVLDSGPYDLGFIGSAYLADEHSLIVTRDWLDGFLEIGLPGYSSEARRAVELSPMLNDLSGLPPALFIAGNLDPLRDDSILMAQRWQLAGSSADLDVWPDAGHTFTNMGTPLGDLGIDRMTTRITSALDEVQATARTLAVT
jgi:acetyl esterase/lipase